MSIKDAASSGSGSHGVARNVSKFVVVALLAMPALASLFGGSESNAENRQLAPPPTWPVSWTALTAAPASATAWIDDHFGFRQQLLKMNNWLRFRLFGEFPTIQMSKGLHERYFLSSHVPQGQPFQAITAVCGARKQASAHTVDALNMMFADFARQGLHPKLLVVPSAPVVYPADLPRWLQGRCNDQHTPVHALLDAPALSPQARAAIFFPLAQMRAIANEAALFPQTWFHWSGEGLDQVARLTLRHFWQRPLDVAPPMAVQRVWMPSDVSQLFPGIVLGSTITLPDPGASHIDSCLGGGCFQEIDGAARILSDITRFHNVRAPDRRLLIISDSFGAKTSAWYARYYRQVEQFATNNVARLSEQQMAEVRAFLFREPERTDILILYHDGGVLNDGMEQGMARFQQGQ